MSDDTLAYRPAAVDLNIDVLAAAINRYLIALTATFASKGVVPFEDKPLEFVPITINGHQYPYCVVEHIATEGRVIEGCVLRSYESAEGPLLYEVLDDVTAYVHVSFSMDFSEEFVGADDPYGADVAQGVVFYTRPSSSALMHSRFALNEAIRLLVLHDPRY